MSGIGKDVHPNAVLSKPKRRAREMSVTTTRAVDDATTPLTMTFEVWGGYFVFSSHRYPLVSG